MPDCLPQMLRPTASTLLNTLLSRRVRRWILRVGLILLLLPLFLQWLIGYVVGSDARLLASSLQRAKNLLIVTAHPDDECLFFSPSILGVLDRNRGVRGSLLVMSTGKLATLVAYNTGSAAWTGPGALEWGLGEVRSFGGSALTLDCCGREQLWDWRAEARGAEGLVYVAGHRPGQMHRAGSRRVAG